MDDVSSVVEGLAGPGFVVLLDAWPNEEVAALRREALAGWEAGGFHSAGVGRGEQLEVRSEIRSDLVRWLDPLAASSHAVRWLGYLEALQSELNRHLFLGLVEPEAHFAIYPAGSFYRRHLDRFRDQDARVISCLLYLNGGWNLEDGGVLRIHPPDGGACIDVLPSGGTVVIFRSDTVEHEVLPARRQRLSIASWLRRRP